MATRGKRRKKSSHGYIFTDLMSCGNCGRAITAEKQKGHVYYRCTKKRTNCDEKYIREEDLLCQIKDALQKVSLPDDWADKALVKLETEKQNEIQSSGALVSALEAKISALKDKLGKLLDAHLDGAVDKQDYLPKKEQLIHEKADQEAKIREIRSKGATWLEPMREFILSSCEAKKIALNGDLHQIRTFLKKIGSNFTVKGKKFEFLAKRGWRKVAEISSFSVVQAR